MSTLPGIPRSERLIVVVGPSGAGKDSVLAAWRQRLGALPVHFAQRVVTRPHERSEPHEAMSTPEFERAVAGGEFATWWQAHGLHYAVRWRELAPLADARWVVVNGSRAHLAALRQQAPKLQAVELTASPELRARRLAARGREDARAVADRLRRDPPAEVALAIHNDTTLSSAVETLHGWWSSMARRGQSAPS
jgi:ribose 1,5-bisphosphokinase